MKKKPLEITTRLYLGLKLSLWAENLRVEIKLKGKSVRKLAENVGLMHRSIDQHASKPKFQFQNQIQYKITNTLKRFIYEADSLHTLSAANHFSICYRLEVWKFSEGRTVDRVGKGMEIPYHPDVDYIFPKRDVLYHCEKLGWCEKVTKRNEYGSLTHSYYLCKPALKLPKIKFILERKDSSSTFRPDSWVS